MQLDHGVSGAWFRSAHEKRGYGWLHLWLLLLSFFLFFLNHGLRLLLLFLVLVIFSPGFLDFNDSLWLRLGLQVGQLSLIAIEVEQLGDPVWLGQR